LTAEQREGIAKTPLAGLLSLGNVQIRRKFCKKVADTYDTEWHGFVFNGRILHIHLQDVANILGLPWEGGEPNLEDIEIHKMVKFIRRFVLCAICRQLCPTSKYTVSAK
jgi:hypothetical protein